MKFSIIVVTYNRAIMLNGFLAQFRNVKYSAINYEIIVVDNGSTDDTRRVCLHFKDILPNVRYVYEPKGGQSFARNTGISSARNTHVLFLDDDEEFGPTILQRYALAWKKYPGSFAIGGKIIARFKRNGRITAMAPHCPEYKWVIGEIDYGNTEKILRYPEMLHSGNLSFRINPKSRNKPMFDTRLGRRLSKRIGLGAEDYEFCLRFHLQHKDIRYIPTPVYNVIDSNRLTHRYKILRNILAGMERNIIDRNLIKKYKNHIPFAFSFQDFVINDLLSGLSGTFNNMLYIAFCLGYYGHSLLPE